jgi:DTW domain-containing protein YfiP
VVAYSGLPGNSTSRSEKGGTRNKWREKTLLTPMDLPDGVAVLYPSEKAIPLEECEPPTGLLVLDATWSHAKRLYCENPWIGDLPHVSLTPSEPSRYRIRKEPELHYLSTLEAIVCALRILEPDTPGFIRLLQSFDNMIEKQSRFIPDLPC